ncbi:MAG TPA: pilus assembly protein TadG-related protein [Caulobacteraceae bacterium]|jgi:Flp pilus assembly protein TadG
MHLPNLPRCLLRDQRGNAGVMTALFVLLLATAVGGATDLTGVNSSGEKLQDAADSAALTATLALARNPTISQSRLEAKAKEMTAPALKGLTGEPVTTTVTVQSLAPAKVNVQLSQDHGMTFAGLLGSPKLTITRHATAMAGKGVELCMLVLSPNQSDAIKIGGTADFTAIRCAVQVNSNSGNALNSGGSSRVKALKTYVVGPAKSIQNWTPTPSFGQKAYADPFASRMPWPTTTTCGQTLTSLAGATKTLTAPLGAPLVLCGGIDIGNSGVLVLKPGTYVIQSGGINVKSGGILDASAGATLVLTDPSATINMQAGGSLRLQAQKTGPWKDVAIAVKPQPIERTSTLIGGGELELDGIVYLPSQKLYLSGGAAYEKKDSPRSFVSNRLEFGGNGTMFVRAQPGSMMRDAQVWLVQ